MFRSFHLYSLIALSGTFGCSDEQRDSDPLPGPVDTEEDELCAETRVDFDGPAEPSVGDTWSVLLYCDDALLMGPMVIQVTPSSLATVGEHTVTFVEAGTGTIRINSGAIRYETDVEVSP
jgi:hypothetical protein